MKLRDYLNANALTLDQFAGRIGKTAATVSRIARGINKPDWDTLEAIERETGGSVTPNDFLPALPDGATRAP
jgi:transcriptional regulator with XRE-family HTH domain